MQRFATGLAVGVSLTMLLGLALAVLLAILILVFEGGAPKDEEKANEDLIREALDRGSTLVVIGEEVKKC